MRSAGFSLSPRNELCVVAVHALSTWFMVGMIWTIQIVHYPLFAFVGSETYEDFQAKHVEVIGVLLVVPWLVEGLSALVLLVCSSGSLRKLAVVGAVLGFRSWLSALSSPHLPMVTLEDSMFGAQ